MLFAVVQQSRILANGKVHELNRSESQPSNGYGNSLGVPDIAVSLTPVALVFSWVVFFVVLRKLRSLLEAKMVFPVKGANQLPCKNCQYYANNHYLRCAVQPSVVLTEESKNCSEYLPKKDKADTKKIF